MKSKVLTLIFGITTSFLLQAQNYQIDFTGTGASTNVDFVKVENLTQCTNLELNGTDILHLVAETGINAENSGKATEINIYPNPTSGHCFVNFESYSSGKTTLKLYDLTGRTIIKLEDLLPKGHHTYELKGLNKGIFILKVEVETSCFNSRIVSINEPTESTEFKHIETISNTHVLVSTEELKVQKSLIEMQYNSGDVLKLTGKSGDFRTVYMLVPSNSQTVTFTFIPCTDANGNNYSIVKIGNQWWMAENLNAGTYAPIVTPQVSGTKFCMNVNGQADPNCPMGGLYEWENMMQGASQCNGTGAPPNDRCTTPVKGLCPTGWHIPSHYEWTTLERNAGSNPNAFPYDMSTISLLGTDEGGNLKETCTTYWWAPNAGATNSSGFSGLPGGDTWNGVFEDFGQSAYFWTSTEPLFFAWVHALNYSLTLVGRSSYAIESGFSVRCVKD
ncbi:MAG: FISUMP domain-containing protein [Bacteroidales bacterium]|nr:FISUMP domain-containing protein [Bacteroidales bacterium]